MIYIVADISKKTVDIGFKTETDCQYVGQFTNDKEGFAALSKWLEKQDVVE